MIVKNEAALAATIRAKIDDAAETLIEKYTDWWRDRGATPKELETLVADYRQQLAAQAERETEETIKWIRRSGKSLQ